MSDYIVHKCFTEGCGATLPGRPGVYYCDACVARQSEAWKREREAFDMFHAFADRVAQATSREGRT